MQTYTWNRNCSQCIHMPNCRSWSALTAARDCPSYDDGTQAQANRAKAEIHQFVHDDAGKEVLPNKTTGGQQA